MSVTNRSETPGEVKHKDLKTKAVKGAGASIVAQLISFLAHTAGIVILARLLQPQDFGLVTMVTAFSLLIMNFGANGFPEYIIQKKSVSNAEINSIFWAQGFISIILMLGFMAAAPLLASFYNEPLIVPIAMVMSTSITLQALSTCHLALLKRDMEFGKVAITQVCVEVASVVLAVMMAVGGCGYWSIVGRQLSIPGGMIIGAWLFCSWRPGIPGQLKSAGESLKYTMSVYGNFTLGYFGRNLDKILLGRFHGTQVLGNYDRAYHLSSMPANQLVTPLHSVALSALTRLRDDSERFARYYTKAISTITFVGMLAGLVLTISGNDLIFILLGPGWDQAGLVVMAFGPGVGAMLTYSTYSWIHLALGKPDRWLRWSIISVVLNILLFAITAPYGPVYVAAAYSISFYILLVPALWYAGVPIGLKMTPIWGSIWPYFISAVCVWSLWLICSDYYVGTSSLLHALNTIQRLCIVLPATGLLYVAMVIALSRSFAPVQEILALIKTILRRDSIDDART